MLGRLKVATLLRTAALQNFNTTNCVALPEMRKKFAEKNRVMGGGGNLLSHYETVIIE